MMTFSYTYSDGESFTLSADTTEEMKELIRIAIELAEEDLL